MQQEQVPDPDFPKAQPAPGRDAPGPLDTSAFESAAKRTGTSRSPDQQPLTSHTPTPPIGSRAYELDTPSNYIYSPRRFTESLNSSPRPASMQWACKEVRERIATLREQLSAAGLDNFRIMPAGSVATGHFTGPKPHEHSLNSKCPAEFKQIIELDMTLILSEDQHPHDPAVIEKMLNGTGGMLTEDFDQATRWGRTIPCSYFYWYEKFSDEIGIECEIGVYREPYCQLEAYFNHIFSQEELQWQTDVREFLRAQRVDYNTEFWHLKQVQMRECNWRIIASAALDRLNAEGSLPDDVKLPDLSEVPAHPAFIDRIVDRWLAGEDPQEMTPGLTRPDYPRLVSEESIERIEQLHPTLLSAIPAAPGWVAAAERIRAAAVNSS